MLVDSGSTSHMVNDDKDFSSVNENFKPENHSIELADGSTQNLAEKQGTVNVGLRNEDGEVCEGTLDDTLYIPSFPQDIFSIRAATKKGSTVTFGPDSSELVTKDGVRFPIREEGNLYYLDTCKSAKTDVQRHDLETWHRIMGHCNRRDVEKLEKVVDGMKIDGKKDISICETCILGKTVQDFDRKPDKRATEPMEFMHTDVCGPITPTAREAFKYVLGFVDDYTGASFAYFLKTKDAAAKGLEKFLADSSLLIMVVSS